MAINREEVLQAAEKYVQRGKIDAALKEYAKVVGEAPTDHNTLNKMGDLYQRQNRLGDAVRYWIQAADVLKGDGFNVRAIAMYKKILRNDATRLDAIESLAELLHKERLVNEARTQYQVLADYYLKHDRTSSAVSVLQKMSELEPENPSHHVKLAELFVKQRLPEKALPEYRIIAQTMLRRGHADEAAQVYMRALDLTAKDLDFIGDAIKALRDADQVAAAARFLTAAIERNPEAEQFSRPSARSPLTRSGSRPAFVEPPPAAPAPPPPAPAESEESLILDLDVDGPPPPTQVMPPPDMAPPQARAAPPAAPPPPPAVKEEFEEIEIDLEMDGLAEPPPPPRPSPLMPSRPDLEAPLEIDWSFAELPEIPPLAAAPPLASEPAPPVSPAPIPTPPVPPPPVVRIDREALERTAAEVQPQVVRRDEDLIAEAEVLAKYGLKEKALDRLREALQLNPRHLGAHELLLHLLIDLGRPDRAVIVARDLRRLAGEARNQEAWERGRSRLLKAGYTVAGERIAAPQEVADDALSHLVDQLAPPPAKAAPAPAAKPSKKGRIDDALAQLASQVLTPAKKKAKPAAPPAAPETKPAALAPPSAAPPPIEVPVEPPPLPEIAELPPVAEEVSWLEEAAPTAPVDRVAEEKLFEDEAQFFDLAAELEKELSDDSVQAVPLPQPQEQSLEEIVEGFKKGVAENLSAEDYDTHFNLGIAYREMGLLDEAIGEFQLASKAPNYLVECCAMLGVCFLDKGLPELAVKWYRRALEVPGLPEEQQLGLLYDLGSAMLSAGDRDAAYKAFVEIYGVNSNYRDVVARLEELGPR
jgi:tetratricopeptide (TPR) repeat protein